MIVAATGFFDGLHLGHRAVIDQLVKVAKREQKESAVISFWPHPRALLQQDASLFRLLTSFDEKEKLVKELSVDHLHIITFDKEFASLSTDQFFKQYLKGKYNVSHLIAGYDHRVGSDPNQTQEEMFEIARQNGIEPIRVERFRDSHQVTISSTKIRNAIAEGEICLANNMLGYTYKIDGVVVVGRRVGNQLGFPTANIRLREPLKLLPADGVYACYATFQGVQYKSVVNIGRRPTFCKDGDRSIEAHILNFDKDIYALSLELKFVRRLRKEVKFPSIDQLKEQLIKDRDKADQVLQ